MLLKDVVDKSNFDDVYKCLIKNDEKVKSVDIDKIKRGYEDIKSLSYVENKEGFTIVIELVKEDLEKYYYVSGLKSDENILYGLMFTEWEEWLGFKVDELLIKTMDFSEITAHCFWEMTWHGWTKKDREYNLAIREKERKRGEEIEKRINVLKLRNELITDDMLEELIDEYKKAETDSLRTNIEVVIEELIENRLIKEQQLKKIIDNFEDEDILKAIKNYSF